MRTTGGLATLRWEAGEAARTPGGKRERRKQEREGLEGEEQSGREGPCGGSCSGKEPSLAASLLRRSVGHATFWL